MKELTKGPVDGTNSQAKLTGEGELSRAPDDSRIADPDEVDRFSEPDLDEPHSIHIGSQQASALQVNSPELQLGQAQTNAMQEKAEITGNQMPVAPGGASSAWSNAFTENFDPLVGQILANRFEIVEILGSGGMSVVYKAKLTSVDKHVAIKTLNIRLQSRPGIRERFSREIETLAKLEHPHIVTVHDCLYGPGDQLFLVMDLLTGKSLDDTLAEEGRLSVERVRKIGIQICAAVKYAHHKGIIHRDLKPGNVMLLTNEQDFVKVVDFGLVKLGEDSRRLTQSGEFWGSPPYVSPEQVKGEPCDARSDVYSLGCVLYELLVGQDPFFGMELFQLLQKHVHEVPPRFAQVRPDLDIPEEMEAIVFKALAKAPADRFQSMAEFQSALEKLGSGNYAVIPDNGTMPVSTPETTPATVSPRRWSDQPSYASGEHQNEFNKKSLKIIFASIVAAIVIFGVVALANRGSGGSTAGDTTPTGAGSTPGTSSPAARISPANYQAGDAANSPVPRKVAPAKPVRTKAVDNRRPHRSIKQKASDSKPQKINGISAAKPKHPVTTGNQWDRLKQRRSSAAQE